MLSARMLVRLILASLMSGAVAGLLLALCLEAESLIRSLRPGGAPPIEGVSFLSWIEIGLILGVPFATMPAFFAGSAMWVLAVSKPGADRPAFWALAGAAMGVALWGLIELVDGPSRGSPADRLDHGFLVVSLVCGAGAALAFRLVMRLSLGLASGPTSPRRPSAERP